MNLRLKLLKDSSPDLFNISNEKDFNTPSKILPGGNKPGGTGKNYYDLNNSFDDPGLSVLSIYDDDKYIGGAVTQNMGKHIMEISIFFLIEEYRGKGIGKTALRMVEDFFQDTEVFRLFTPSHEVSNVAFYVNKCGYQLIEVINLDRNTNTADYVFEKRINRSSSLESSL